MEKRKFSWKYIQLDCVIIGQLSGYFFGLFVLEIPNGIDYGSVERKVLEIPLRGFQKAFLRHKRRSLLVRNYTFNLIFLSKKWYYSSILFYKIQINKFRLAKIFEDWSTLD